MEYSTSRILFLFITIFFTIYCYKKSIKPENEFQKLDYLVKGTSIINCDANKIYGILTDLSLRREWDNFIKKPEDLNFKTTNPNLVKNFF